MSQEERLAQVDALKDAKKSIQEDLTRLAEVARARATSSKVRAARLGRLGGPRSITDKVRDAIMRACGNVSFPAVASALLDDCLERCADQEYARTSNERHKLILSLLPVLALDSFGDGSDEGRAFTLDGTREKRCKQTLRGGHRVVLVRGDAVVDCASLLPIALEDVRLRRLGLAAPPPRPPKLLETWPCLRRSAGLAALSLCSVSPDDGEACFQTVKDALISIRDVGAAIADDRAWRIVADGEEGRYSSRDLDALAAAVASLKGLARTVEAAEPRIAAAAARHVWASAGGLVRGLEAPARRPTLDECRASEKRRGE